MDKRWIERIKLRHMRAILAVRESGSLTAAAQRLFVSQAAVSKVVAEAEAILGLALFERRGRGVALTVAGKVVVDGFQRVMLELHALGAEVDQLDAGGSGLLTIGLQAVSVVPVLANVVARVKQRYPLTTIQLVEGRLPDVLAGLRGGHYDVVVGRMVGSLLGHDLQGLALWLEPYSVVASAGHPILAIERPSWPDALGHGWCLPPAGTPVRDQLREHLAQLMLPEPRVVVEAHTLATTLALLRSMAGLSLLPRYSADAGQLRGELALVPLALPPLADPIGLIWRKDVSLSPAARMFREETQSYIDNG